MVEEIPQLEMRLCSWVTVGHGKDAKAFGLRLDTLVCMVN